MRYHQKMLRVLPANETPDAAGARIEREESQSAYAAGELASHSKKGVQITM